MGDTQAGFPLTFGDCAGLTQVSELQWGAGVYVNSMPPEDSAAFLRDTA